MNRKILQTAIAILFIATTALQAKTIYVKTGGSDSNTGDSWGTAYATLQKALDNAVANDQIWVANGTYKPTAKAGNGTADRDMAFVLKPDVKLYGGFAGTEASLAERQLPPFGTESATILNGEHGLNIDSYHVVLSVGSVGTACLDGFTITGSWASETGSITVNGRSIDRNWGGGMFISVSSPTITNVTIRKNRAENGAGMFLYDCSPTLTNVIITENTVTENGGGMFNDYSSSPTLTNVNITGNTASKNGGGMYNEISSPTLNNVSITGNTAENGGGMYNYSSSSPTLTNVNITENTAENGGGMFNDYYSSPTLTNVNITENTAKENGGGIYNDGSTPVLTDVEISKNVAVYGGGMYNSYSAPILINVAINVNVAMGKLIGNTSGRGGGMHNNNSSPELTNVIISGNMAMGFGTSCNGGGMYNNISSPILTNVTISGNTAISNGGGMFDNSSSTPQLRNSIIWGNNTGVNDATRGTYSHCLIQDIALTGNGNLDGTKTYGSMFVNAIDPSDPTAEGDYRLVVGSPCINAGNNSFNTTATDLAGNPRKNGTIDMGAYEYYQLYTVTFHTNGGSSIAPKMVTKDMPIGAVTTTRAGYTLEGWYKDDNTFSIKWNILTDIVSEDMHLYAKWTPGTSISDAQTSTVSIYPNPAQSTLYIMSSEAVEQVSIYDISGRMLLSVMSSVAETSPTNIDISTLATGIYLVKVKTVAGEVVKKIVKQ